MNPDLVRPEGRRALNAARKEATVQLAALELSELAGYPAVTTAAIAARAGVTERTIFRTFGSKAGIFWHRPFLQRMVERMDPGTAAADPLAAVSDAVAAAARAMTAEERAMEDRRRRIVLAEPELSAAGTRSMNQHVQEMLRLITDPEVSDEQRRRLDLFAVFAAISIASVPLDAHQPIDEWVIDLQRSVRLAAHGPLPATAGHQKIDHAPIGSTAR